MGSSSIGTSNKNVCTVLDELQSPARTVEIERYGHVIRLRWYVHVIRRDEGALVRDIME
jgi:hypothetical protein